MYYSEERNDTFTNKIIIKVITTNWHTELFHVNFEIRDYIKFIFYWLGKRRSQTLARDGYFRGTGQFFLFIFVVVWFSSIYCLVVFVVKVTCHLLSMLKWIYVCKQKLNKTSTSKWNKSDLIKSFNDMSSATTPQHIFLFVFENEDDFFFFFVFYKIIIKTEKKRV